MNQVIQIKIRRRFTALALSAVAVLILGISAASNFPNRPQPIVGSGGLGLIFGTVHWSTATVASANCQPQPDRVQVWGPAPAGSNRFGTLVATETYNSKPVLKGSTWFLTCRVNNLPFKGPLAVQPLFTTAGQPCYSGAFGNTSKPSGYVTLTDTQPTARVDFRLKFERIQ